MHVLFAEDEPLLRMEATAASEEARLAEAASADAALGLAALARPVPSPPPPAAPPSVPVTAADLGPASGLDGIALAEALRRHWPGRRVVVTTGCEAHLARCAALAPRVCPLVKPFDPALLVRTVFDLAAPPAGASRR